MRERPFCNWFSPPVFLLLKNPAPSSEGALVRCSLFHFSIKVPAQVLRYLPGFFQGVSRTEILDNIIFLIFRVIEDNVFKRVLITEIKKLDTTIKRFDAFVIILMEH